MDESAEKAAIKEGAPTRLSPAEGDSEKERAEASERRKGERVSGAHRAIHRRRVAPRSEAADGGEQEERKVGGGQAAERRLCVGGLIEAFLGVCLLVVALLKGLAEGAEPDVEEGRAEARVVVLKVPVVDVVEGVGLEVVFVARVGGAGCDYEVDAVPEEVEGGGEEDEIGEDA